MKALPAIIILTAAQCSWAVPVDADSVGGINSFSAANMSLSHQAVSKFYDGSDADRFYRQSYSFNDISASFYHRREAQAAEPWNGAGESKGAFDASAYLRLGKKSVATAGAGYETGMVRDVQWNSTADYAMLYPYVIADSLGGDLHREQYHFHGGFAAQAGKFVYGLGAKYRAIHQYRDYDPRPRNMATDLSVAASGSMALGSHALGIGGSLRFYKQVMDVAYYSQGGANSTQFHFTGLGHTFGRLDGTSCTETRHKGFGFGGSVSFLPVNRLGFMAEAAFESLRMKRQIHEFNEVPATVLRTYTAQLRLGYRFGRGNIAHLPYIKVGYQRRRGQEAVIDNGFMGEFAVIGSHEKYRLNHLCANAAWLLSSRKGRWTIEAEPSIMYSYEKEDYVEPYAKIEYANLFPGLSLQFMRESSRWLFSYGVDAWGRFNVSGDFSLNPSHINDCIYTYEAFRFERLTSECESVSPSFTLQYRLESLGAIYLHASYAERFHRFGSDWAFGVALGWRFY